MRYLIDLHCHTLEKSYDGKVPAADIVRTLLERGFHGVVFTDHNHVWSDTELAALRAEAGAPPEFLLASGQEVRTQVDGLMGGDLLVYGPTVDLPDGTEAAEVIRLIQECSGFCIAAHPSVPGIGFGRFIGDFPVAAAEAWNGRYGGRVAAASEALAEQFDLPRTGGSDTHQPQDIGGGATAFDEMPRHLADLKRLIITWRGEPWKPPVTKRLAKWLKRGEG